jgi:flagellar hook-associated protein 2
MATTTPTLSSPGIGSGLDVQGIVDKLMQVESQPLNDLDTKETKIQSQISAYGTLKSALASLQTAVHALGSPAPFRSTKATVASASVASATGSSGAVAGNYSLEVSALAQNQKLVSNGFAAVSSTVGSGSLTFTFGTFASGAFTPNASAGSRTVTIAAGQSSLAGIRDAVNAANIGVTASIVNDGSANGQRLVFTPNASGADQGLRITVADDDGNDGDAAGLSQLAYDPTAAAGSGKNLTETRAAQDAAFTLDGIAIRSSSNTVTDAIAGVTLSLAGTNVGAPTTVSVTQDAGPATTAVQTFITAYNALQTTITSLTKYDAANKQASILTGDSTVRLVQSQLRSLIGGSVSGAAAGVDTLSAIGITTQTDGTLALDTTKFNAALTSDPSSVSRLFASTAVASDSLVAFKSATSRTVAGSYAVNITQLATQGTLVGSAAAGLTITAGVNDAITATVDGVSISVTLDAATYASADALAAAVAAKINGALAQGSSGSAVTIANDGGVLTLASNRYGSASTVQVGGTAAATLLGATPAATAGLDVAGTIGGLAANGSGQSLIGAAGSAVDGLTLSITGGSTGARGSVTYAQGVGYGLDQALTSVLGLDGALQARTDGLQSTIKDIDKRKDALQTRLDAVQQAYLNQFNALDEQLSQLSTLSTYLAQQLASLPKINSSSD